MPVEIITKVVGTGWFKAASDEDMLKAGAYKHNSLVKLTISGIRKTRSYRELSCYKGSCRYIANMNFDENKDTPDKVDFITKVKCGFVEKMVVDTKNNRVFYKPKSLSYANCDHPESHKYIADALEKHAGLVGLTTEQYVQLLNEQK